MDVVPARVEELPKDEAVVSVRVIKVVVRDRVAGRRPTVDDLPDRQRASSDGRRETDAQERAG